MERTSALGQAMRARLLLFLTVLAGACAVEPTPLPSSFLLGEPTQTAIPLPDAELPLRVAVDERLRTLIDPHLTSVEVEYLAARPSSLGTDIGQPNAWIGLDPMEAAIDCLVRVEVGITLDEDMPVPTDLNWQAVLHPDRDATAARLMLANIGYPDGYFVDVTGLEWIVALWNARLDGTGLQFRLVPAHGAGQVWAVFAHNRTPSPIGHSIVLPPLPIFCTAGSGIGIEPIRDALPRIFRML